VVERSPPAIEATARVSLSAFGAKRAKLRGRRSPYATARSEIAPTASAVRSPAAHGRDDGFRGVLDRMMILI
jgi:hypothetical protein